MESRNSPLALAAWIDGPNSYLAAFEAIQHVIAHESDYPYSDNEALASFVLRALCGRLVAQADANDLQYKRIKSMLSNDQADYIRGIEDPAELTRFLHDTDSLDSIETRRRTHLTWNVWAEVDAPFRNHLDKSPQLHTVNQKSKILYRIKDLNIADSEDQHFVQVDRKRTVRQHFGGAVLTVARNSFVLHNVGDHMPRRVRSVIEEQRHHVKEKNANNYDEHNHRLYDALEQHVANRQLHEKPRWVVPLLTTYYAVKYDAVKASELKDFS